MGRRAEVRARARQGAAGDGHPRRPRGRVAAGPAARQPLQPVILRRILLALAGITALSVSAGVIVVALAYALYALVKPEIGPAGGAAVVAAAAAILIGLIGLMLTLMARPPKPKPGQPQ